MNIIFSKEHRVLFISFLLVLCALSASRVLIYNEELLVALSFLAFVTFCYNKLGTMVAETLDARQASIQEELERSLEIQLSYVNELLQEHKERMQLAKGLNHLQSILTSELEQLENGRNAALYSQLNSQVYNKLVNLENARASSQGFLQQSLATGFRTSVLEAFQKSEASKKKIQLSLVKSALKELSNK